MTPIRWLGPTPPRRRRSIPAPPGHYYARGFPVLSAGPTPRTPLGRVEFSIQDARDEARSWTRHEFTAPPAEDVTVAIHCVTKWASSTRDEGRRDGGRLGDRVRGRRLHGEHGARGGDRRAGVDPLRVGRCARWTPSTAGSGASLWQVGEKGTVNNEIETACRARLHR